MGLAEKIAAKVEQLPAQAQAEVLDFVEFLALRSRTRGHTGSWTDDEFEVFALTQLAGEDEPVQYELADCREVP